MNTILKRSGGFTLIEIMITLLVSSVVMIALYQTFSSQQKSYMVQENRVEMQQSLRGALIVMTGDIRMAGFDKMRTGNFGITDIRPRDIDDDVETGATGYSSLEVTIDWDEDGIERAPGGGGVSERIKYSIYDFIGGDNAVDLARNSDPANVGSRRVLAENIRAFGLAFAFDDDLDGRIDTYDPVGTAVPPANQPVIWAIDSDGDNILDTNLDTNLDGVINVNDSPGGPGSNGIIAGVPLPAGVPVSSIRAVRIWLLGETDQADPDFTQQTTFQVGKYVITPNDNKRMTLLIQTVQCRNLGL